MSTSDTMRRLIAKQTSVLKLETLRNTGLAIMVADLRLSDFAQCDADELVAIINTKIVELGGTV